MKRSNKIILITSIIFFVLAANYFIDPVKIEDATPDDSKNDVTDIEKKYNELYIDYLNLEGENENLNQEIESLKDSLFETENHIFDSELVGDFLPFPESTEILYKEISETKIVIFYNDEMGNHLIISSKDPRLGGNLDIRSLNPANGFSWGLIKGPDYNFFGGVITDNRVKGVNVLQNEKVHETEIFEIDDNVRVWYSIFNYETKSTLDKPDKMKIEALNKEGIILSRFGGQ